MFLPIPPALQAEPPVQEAPLDAYAAAEVHALEAVEDGKAPLPVQLRGAADRQAYAWLRTAGAVAPEAGPLKDPFPARSGAHREAEALRAFLARPESAALARLSLQLTGTRVALWRWGRRQDRAGWAPDLRRAWEDRLMDGGHAAIQGWALRHALCFALAEKDEARLAELKGRVPDTEPVLQAFQAAFGLLGGPSPTFRLWAFPDLDYRDLRLDELGPRRIWISPPPEAPLAPLPSRVAWIVPSLNARVEPGEAMLPEFARREAEAAAAQLPRGVPAWYVPSRQDWVALGLEYFPILIELDAQGRVAAIRMGDAAPERP